MNDDINIIPVLLEAGDRDKINLDHSYESFTDEDGGFFNASVIFSINGLAREDYNIYAILSNYDHDNNQSKLLLGGFSLKKESFYNNSSRLNFKSPILDNMKNEFKIDIYKVGKENDEYKKDLTDGFFKQFQDPDVDLNFLLNKGIKTSSVSFYLS